MSKQSTVTEGIYQGNYQNYLYLFNDYESVKITGPLKEGKGSQVEGSIVPLDVGYTLEGLAGLLKGGEDTQYQHFATGATFFPFAQYAQEKGAEEVLVGETWENTMRTPPIPVVKKTNDPLCRPFSFHGFSVELDEEVNAGKKQHFVHDVTMPNGWYFKIPPSITYAGTGVAPPARPKHIPKSLRIIAPTQTERENYTLLPPNPPLRDPEASDIFFYQDLVFGTPIAELSTDNVDAAAIILGQSFEWMFTSLEYMSGLETMKNNACEVGVPYDFETVLMDDLKNKNMGIKFMQPVYEKIYNYYDPQYNPMAYAIAEEISDEKALPSIYDFLYLPDNDYLRSFLLFQGMTEEELTLGNLNQYLDNFSKYYEKFIGEPEEAAVGMTFEQAIASFTPPASLLYGTNTHISELVNNYQPKFLEMGVTLTQPTQKEIFIDSLKSIATDDESLAMLKTEKPIWINQSKQGIYFSEKSMDIFNQTIDKDGLFPQLIKINIPTEKRGPLTKLFSKRNLLDNLNGYAASQVVSQVPNQSTYSNYYGAVINGKNSTNFNSLFDTKFKSFRIYFENWKALSLDDIMGLTVSSDIIAPYDNPAYTDKPVTTDAVTTTGMNLTQTATDTAQEIGTFFQDQEIETSWVRRQIDDFVEKVITPEGIQIDGEQVQLVYTWFTDATISKDIFGTETTTKLYEYEEGKVLVPPGTGAKLKIFAKCMDTSSEWCQGANESSLLDFIPDSVDYEAETIFDKDPEVNVGSFSTGSVDYLVAKNRGFGLVNNTIETVDWTQEAYDEELAKMEKFQMMYEMKNALPKDFVVTIPPETVNAVKGIDKAFEGFFRESYASDVYIDDFLTQPFKSVVVYNDKKTLLSDNSSLQALISKLQTLAFKKELKKLFLHENLLRTAADIQNSKLAHQETLMYEIAKYEVDSQGTQTFIQSFFLPSVEQEMLSYYDTQVIPEKDYFYKIFTHKIIVGTEYSPVRSNIEQGDHPIEFVAASTVGDPAVPENFYCNLRYKISPYFEIVRLPFYNQEVVNIKQDKLNYSRVEDSPPLPPQVQVVPFRNINNKIMFLFNNSIGSVEEYPQIVFEQEKMFFENVALSQDKLPGQKLLFKSDDSLGKFQIYRMESLPESYITAPEATNFAVITVDNGTNAKDTSHIETIVPNKEYYFFFRFVDMHDKISNPTTVYKIKMVAHRDITPYLTMETVDINQKQKDKYEENFSPIKKLQKYLYIEPSVVQNTVTTPSIEDFEEAVGSYLKEPVFLGDPKGDAVFGKKFKLRITSKQTGRKMDINLTIKEPETTYNDT